METDGSTGDMNSKISVSATGEVTAEPDRAVLTVGVEATAANPETARKRSPKRSLPCERRSPASVSAMIK
jgi:uncharacterized protein YggE